MIKSSFQLRCDDCDKAYPRVADDIEDLKVWALDDEWKRTIKLGSSELFDLCPDCFAELREKEQQEYKRKQAEENKSAFAKELEAKLNG
jgi:hypothetical protein